MHSILFVILMFVSRKVVRTMIVHRTSEILLTKIGTASVLGLSALVPLLCFTKLSLIYVILVSLVIYAVVLFIPIIEEHVKLRTAAAFRLSFLTNIILQMSSGRSLRISMESQIEREKDLFWKKWIVNFLDDVSFSQQKHFVKEPMILQQLRSSLLLIEQSSFQQMDQLRRFRSICRKEYEFRRRSGQALSQVRLQAAVLLVLHLAVTVFMIHQFGWHDHKTSYVTSLLLAAAGIYWISRMARGHKWKT